MALSLARRGNIWQVQGTINGIRVRESTKTQSRDKAEQIRAEIEYEYLTGQRAQGESRNTAKRTFREVARLYQQSRRTGSSRTTQFTVGKLVGYFGQLNVDQIDTLRIEQWVNETHTSKGNSNNTIRREMAQLQAILNFGAELGLRPTVKIQKPPEDQGRTRVMTTQEERIIWYDLPFHMEVLCTFILNTGARPSEALRLTWDDVNLEKNFVKLWSRKGRGKSWSHREVPLNGEALKSIRLCKDKSASNVFLCSDGTPWSSHWEFDKQWKRVVKDQLGIKNLNPYDLRHTFATRLARAGTPVKVIADLLGHADLRMVMRYMNTDSSDLRAAVDALSPTGSLLNVV